MPEPIALCLETLIPEPPPEQRFLQCVALAGGQAGLGLDEEGQGTWEQPSPFGLWVSADERLALMRGPGAPPIQVHRAGRSVEVPEDKPTFLLDQDELELGGRRLKVHFHGVAQGHYAPAWLAVGEPLERRKIPPPVPEDTPTPSTPRGPVPIGRPIEIRDVPPAPMPPDRFNRGRGPGDLGDSEPPRDYLAWIMGAPLVAAAVTIAILVAIGVVIALSR